MDYDDLKMCNCAGCNKELLSRVHEDDVRELGPEVRKRLPEFVGGRRRGRPYCMDCIRRIELS